MDGCGATRRSKLFTWSAGWARAARCAWRSGGARGSGSTRVAGTTSASWSVRPVGTAWGAWNNHCFNHGYISRKRFWRPLWRGGWTNVQCFKEIIVQFNWTTKFFKFLQIWGQHWILNWFYPCYRMVISKFFNFGIFYLVVVSQKLLPLIYLVSASWD